ncbi:MAG: AAA family ATPase [Coprobacillus sp.]
MKNLFLISGTMGIGKTTICQELKKSLDKSAFLDGDWCWDIHPFIVNEETKKMVFNNIVYQLNQFIHCSQIENVIFGWVMHEQSIIDEILSRIDTNNVIVYSVSLICSEEQLRNNFKKDIALGLRKEEDIQKSINRLSMYKALNTKHIDITNKSIQEVVIELKSMIG